MAYPEKIAFCAAEDVKKQGMVTRWVEEWREELCALYRDGQFQVLSSICPHAGGPFSPSPCGRKLQCQWHGLEFGTDGKCLSHPKMPALRKFRFQVVDGRIEVFFQ